MEVMEYYRGHQLSLSVIISCVNKSGIKWEALEMF